MKILLLIYSNDKDRILRVQEFLCEFKSSFHHRQPLAMSVHIVSVNIVAVVFPVLRIFFVIRRVDVDAIDLACVHILKKLKSMVVICLDKRMPKITVRCIADSIDWLQIRINWLAEFGYNKDVIHIERMLGFVSIRNTESNISLLVGFTLAILATIFLTPIGGFVAGVIFMLLAVGASVLGMVPGNRVFLLGAGGTAGFLIGCLLWIII